MKKTLLFGALALASYSNAQMTQANEASIGTLESLYLCDSFAVNLDGVTGMGVTWDYTNLAGYENEQRDVEVVDPTSTTYASDFPSSTQAILLGSSITSYYSSTASDRTSHGFMFNEPTFGDVIAKFDTDPEIVATYPFAQGNSVSDVFSGSIDYLGGAASVAATGVSYATVDGEGTLDLPGGVSLSNVIRYKLVDTSWATITIPINLGDMEFIRTQYEYYDYTVSNLPVFIHSTITVQNVGASTPTTEVPLVLSYYPTTEFVGLNDQEEVSYSVYPNPANDLITLHGDFGADATATLVDQSGRVLGTYAIGNGTKIDISAFENGMYILNVHDNGATGTQTIVKK